MRLPLATLAMTILLPLCALAAEDEGRCEKIASIIDLYLNNNADEAELKAIDLSKADNEKANDPLGQAMAVLAGAKNIDFKTVAVQTMARPDAWALVSMARFARELSSSPSLDRDYLANDLVNYQNAMASGASSQYATKWRDRAPAWLTWCNAGFPSSKELEPLLKKRSHDVSAALPMNSIDWISAEDFKRTRDAFAKRPRPAGLEFKDFEIERYLNSLENDGLRNLERERYVYIKDIKVYLVRLFTRSAYNGKIKMLDPRRNLAGTVALANDKYIIVREGNKSVKCDWKDLALEQFVDFLCYDSKNRAEVTGPNLSKAERDRDAADELAHAAMLCDWYGNYNDALTYARAAMKMSPEVAAQISKLMLGAANTGKPAEKK